MFTIVAGSLLTAPLMLAFPDHFTMWFYPYFALLVLALAILEYQAFRVFLRDLQERRALDASKPDR